MAYYSRDFVPPLIPSDKYDELIIIGVIAIFIIQLIALLLSKYHLKDMSNQNEKKNIFLLILITLLLAVTFAIPVKSFF